MLNNLNPLGFLGSSRDQTSKDILDYDFAAHRVDSPIILVFPSDETTHKFKPEAEQVVCKILSAYGQDSARIYYSSNKEHIFMEFRPKMEEIRKKAAFDNIHMELSPHRLQELSKSGIPSQQIAPFEIGDNERFTPYRPFQHIYGKYQAEDQFRTLYECKHHREAQPFGNALQIKVALSLLENKKLAGGLELVIPKLKAKGVLVDCFPLHEEVLASNLAIAWYKGGHTYPWNKPFEKIKNYFGEKVGLYYRFLGHYTSYLFFLMVVGIPFQIAVFSTDNYSNPGVPFYALFVVLWAVFFTEHWKRIEKNCAMKWGMVGYEVDEPDRPQYEGELMASLINGKPIVHFSRKKSNQRLRTSIFYVFLLISFVIGTTACVYLIRNHMFENGGEEKMAANYTASLLNAIQITVFALFYGPTVKKMTDRENHRTNTEYEDSMIAKLFLFQCVNFFSSFAFTAFCAKFLPKLEGDKPANVGQCGSPDCMKVLAINLIIVLVVHTTVGNIVEFILPKFSNYISGATDASISTAERQFLRPGYDYIQDQISDYAELMVQFGFQTLFISALPGASLIAFINNHLQLRYDAEKMLCDTQRVFPKGGEDIGTWQPVFELMATLAVIANAALVAFTMNIFDDYSLKFRFWLFMCTQWFVFTLQTVIRIVIPDVPIPVTIQLGRQEFIVRKVIDYEPDDLDKDVSFVSDITIDKVHIHDHAPKRK